MLGLLGQRAGREGEGSRCCRPVVSWGLETLQVPLAAIEGDMWDRFQSRQQTPSNKPISFTLLAPTAAERGGLLLQSQRLLWPTVGCWRILCACPGPCLPSRNRDRPGVCGLAPLGHRWQPLCVPVSEEGWVQCGCLNSTVCLSRASHNVTSHSEMSMHSSVAVCLGLYLCMWVSVSAFVFPASVCLSVHECLLHVGV